MDVVITRARRLDRRRFLISVAAVGGGVALGFELPPGPQAAHANSAPELTAWIVIRPDDTVVIRVARSEMGQGVSTALPMLIAEELECDWSKVKVEFPSPDENLRRQRVWGDFSTGGSRSVRNSQAALRTAGATAREMLIAAAAARWQVASSECRAARSVIIHGPSGRSVRFGEVAADAAHIEPPKDVSLKDPKDWTLAGRPTRRLDTIDKVVGKPIYGIDVQIPNMLYAALAQCPVFKGTLKSVDDTVVAGMKGVRKVVKLKDAVAVVADGWWQAKRALDALSYRLGRRRQRHRLQRIHWRISARRPLGDGGRRRPPAGRFRPGFAKAVKRIEADYEVPFLGHATMEPQNCTAHVTGDSAEIWVPTQNGEGALATAANTLGVPPANVKVHKMILGGGFGRRGAVQDFVASAVLIAREMDRPVKTIWSREEDIRHDYYRPVAMARMTAGLDKSGLPLAWHVRLSGNSIFATLLPNLLTRGIDRHFQEGFLEDMPYDVPNYLADYSMRNTHVPVGFWRCVNHTQNCFFKESFIDEMAHAAGADPYQYRRRLIRNHRHGAKFIGVLDAAAQRAGWGRSPPAGNFPRHRTQ